MLAGCATPRSDRASVPETTGSTSSSTPAPASPPPTTGPPGPEAYEGLTPVHFGTSLPGIVSTVSTQAGARTIALTFDGCGGPSGSAVDEGLVATLRAFGVPATLFLSESWIEANPETTRDLVGDPLFRVENHGTRHLPLSVTGAAAYGIPGTTSPAGVIEEIEGNRELLRSYGVESTWFRAGTAHYDDISVRIAADRGVNIAGFAVNGDDGASAAPGSVAGRIIGAHDGAIVLAHMNHPSSGTAAGVRMALESLRGTDARFAFLDGTTPTL